jgi:Zn-dependent protease
LRTIAQAGTARAANSPPPAGKFAKTAGQVHMVYILGFLLSLREVALAAYDIVTRRLRRRYTYQSVIKAPVETVRALISGPDITFAKANLRCVEEPLPGAGGAVLTRSYLGGKPLSAIAARKIEDNEDALTIQYLPELSENAWALGTDDILGTAFDSLPGGATRLRMYRELTHRRPGTRITAPMGLRSLAWLVKTEAEERAGTAPTALRRWLMQTAWLLAALASFWWLAGWRDAVILAVLVALHELGHALAMGITGRGVRFVTLIPFIGGMAMPKRMYESDAQHAFVALMGPGLSLLPTIGLIWYAYSNGSQLAAHAGLLFAVINGINLLPLAALDGGVVVNALLHTIHRRLAQAIAWFGTLAGFVLAFYLQSVLIGIVFVFAGLQIIQQASLQMHLRRKRLRWFEAPVLLVAMALICCAYFLAIGHGGSLNNTMALLVPPATQTNFAATGADEEPSHCWMPSTSRQALEVYLDTQLQIGDWSAIPIMLGVALAAGDGDIVGRWLTQNAGRELKTQISSGTVADLGEALRLMRTGTVAEIGAFLARASAENDKLYGFAIRLLTVNGRYDEAIALATANPDRVTKWRLVNELLRAGAWDRAVAFHESQPLNPEILELTGTIARSMNAMNRKAEARAFLQRLMERARLSPEGTSHGRPPEVLYWLVRLGAEDIVLSPQDKSTMPGELVIAVAIRVAQLEDAGDAAGAQALLASFAKASSDESAGMPNSKGRLTMAVMIAQELPAARARVKLERGGLTAAEASAMRDVDFEQQVHLREEYLRQGRLSDVEAYDLRRKRREVGGLEIVRAVLSVPAFDAAAAQRYMEFAYAEAKRSGFEAAGRFERRSGRILCYLHPKVANGGLWRAWFTGHVYVLKAAEEGRLAPAVLNQF